MAQVYAGPYAAETTCRWVGQRQALGYLAVRLFATGFGLALVFFAVFCALTGVLILRSRLMPRVIGAMMIVAGVCYFVADLFHRA